MESVIKDFKQIGENTIDIELLIKKWNRLWCLSEWRLDDKWTLLKYVRIDSPRTSLRTVISSQQARELIERLNLKAESSIFRSGFTWRREQDSKDIEKWRMAKLNKKSNN